MEFLYEMLAKTVDVNFGSFSFPLPYVEVSVIVVLLFLLVLSLAQFRRHYVDWSFKGALFGILFGFLLALTLEGFLIVSGRTVVTDLLGWKNAPKPLQIALDSGRGKLIQVLGAQDKITSAFGVSGSADAALQVFQSLGPDDRRKIKSLICAP